MMRNNAPNNALFLFLSALVIALDQYSKHLVVLSLPHYSVQALLPHLNLVHLHNTGAAFSMFREAPALAFVGLAAAVAAGILAWLRKHPAGERFTAAGLCLILGGAVGNVIDRLRIGHVTDFIDFYVGDRHFAAFNIADAAISVGAGLLILEMLLETLRSKTAMGQP